MLETRGSCTRDRRNSGRRRRSRRNEGTQCGKPVWVGMLLCALLWWWMSSRSGKTNLNPCSGHDLINCEDELQKTQFAMDEKVAEVTTLTVEKDDLAHANELLVADVSNKIAELVMANAVAKEFFYTYNLGIFVSILCSSFPFWFLLFLVKRSQDATYGRLLNANEVKAEELLAMQRRIDELTSQLKETSGRLRDAEFKNNKMADEVHALKRALEAANQPSTRELRLLEMERRIDRKKSERNDFFERFAALARPSPEQRDLEQLRTKNKLQGEQLKEMTSENGGLKKALDQANNWVNILSGKLQDARAQTQTLRAEKEKLKTANRERGDDKNSLTAQLAEAARKLADCMSVCSTLRDANGTLKNRCDALEDENGKLKGEVSVCRGVHMSLVEQIDKMFLSSQLKQQMEGGAGSRGSGGGGEQ